MALSTSPPLQTDTWVQATWADFLAALNAVAEGEGRGYFDNGYMRMEMAPLGAVSLRHTYIIGPDGTLKARFLGVRPAIHSQEVLATLEALQSPA